MGNMENKILSFLGLGYQIDTILKELDMDSEQLADTIIELETKGLINLKDKSWVLTQKGKDILKEIKKELLKELKIEYLYGNITKDIFQKKRKELESIITTEKSIDHKVGENEDKEKKINCSKCGKDNKIGSRYCYKCGESLKSES